MAAKKEKVVNTSVSQEAKKIIEDVLKEEKELEFVSTGNVGLDLGLTNGEGLPLGSSVLLYAEPGCGKTTLVGDMCRRLIELYDKEDDPFKVLYLDSEGSATLLESIGLWEHKKNKKFLYFDKSLNWRQVETLYTCILNKSIPELANVKLVVIDSVGNILSDANTEKSIADGDFGTKARERGNFYSKFLPLCREHGITSIFISQVRNNQEATTPYVDKKKAAATYADKHSVDIIIKCSSKSDKQEAEKVIEQTVFGENKNKFRWIMSLNTVADGCKNRFFKGGISEVLLVKGKGTDNSYAIRKILEAHKLLKSPSSGWFTFSEELCSSFGLPESKMRLADVKSHIKNNIADIISFIKDHDLYKLSLDSEATYEADDEDYDDEEE